MSSRFFSSVAFICMKDLQVWRRQWLLILGTLLLPLTYFLVVFLGAQAVSRNPVALVNLDRGTSGARIVAAFATADVFRAHIVSAQQAEELYTTLQVAAIITIPPDFSRKVQTHVRAPLEVQVNNYDLDLTNDIRRAVPQAIITYYQGLGSASPITIHIADHSLRQQDVELFQYSVLPILVLVATVNGVSTTALAATNEWEDKTIKELLLAPCGPLAIIVGKVLAGFVTTALLAMGMVVLGAFLGLIEPKGLYWLSVLTVIALGSCFSSGLGIAIGAFLQRKQPVIFVSTVASVWLFALAGGPGVIFFEPEWLQQIAVYDPLTYAIHSLQMAVFYRSFDQFPRDVTVLVAATIGSLIVGSLAMRRGIVAP